MNQQLNDERAKHAYDFVLSMTKKNDEFQKKLRSLARSFPAMIQNNGFCAAVAFLEAKDEDHRVELSKTIKKWLIQKNDIQENEKLMQVIVNLSQDIYQMRAKEIMAYLLWVKRFSEGMLKADE